MHAISFARNRINRIPLSVSLTRRDCFIQPAADHFRRRLLRTFSHYQPLWDTYEQHIPLKDRHCLHQLEKG